MLYTIIDECKNMFYRSIDRAKHSALLYLEVIDEHVQAKSKRMEKEARHYAANSSICVWDLEKEA